MIFDASIQLSNAQDITGSTYSTGVWDMGERGVPMGVAPGSVGNREIGPGEPIAFACRVVKPFNNLSTLTITIQTDSTPAFSAPKTPFVSPTYSLADLLAGKRNLLPTEIPIGLGDRYLRLYYLLTGTAPTMGAITAGPVLAWS